MCNCDRTNMARSLCLGESRLMDMWPLLMMLSCLRVLVASHLLHFLKVGNIYQWCASTFIYTKIRIHWYLIL